jgi:hypothetical protein
VGNPQQIPGDNPRGGSPPRGTERPIPRQLPTHTPGNQGRLPPLTLLRALEIAKGTQYDHPTWSESGLEVPEVDDQLVEEIKKGGLTDQERHDIHDELQRIVD